MVERKTIGLVEDHPLVALGLQGSLEADGVASVWAPAVAELLQLERHLDLAVLDLNLADGSRVAANVAALRAAELNVLVLTGADNAALVREAARSDVLGIVRKSLPEHEVREAVQAALRGETVTSLEWAAALDADPDLPDARLSPREREILALYASGEQAKSVARVTGLTAATVANYISRIRTKYADVGRRAESRVDLYHRAVEDRLIQDGG
ncbi:response regulator transcription factor [Ruania alkalisoli]|uniref:response regulator transcription factor n=1 Tax=Ruania alkalisoli TaxID=2779775 RepID=UPI001FE70032|nr:response regulator transcription factor [Ruania alkalisoli]